MKRSLPDGAAPHARATWKTLLHLTAAGGLLLSLFALGCAGSLDPGVGGGGGSGGVTCPAPGCEVAVLAGNCNSCHGTASHANGLDLQSANVCERLLGMPTFTGPGAACAQKTLLDRGSNPATGVFIDKITKMDGDAALCGLAMPLGGALAQADLACLKTWAASVTTATSAAPAGETP